MGTVRWASRIPVTIILSITQLIVNTIVTCRDEV